MGEEGEAEKQRFENGRRAINGEIEEKGENNILKFLDSVDSYLILMNHLSSTLRQGWLDLASARHSMGTSRISSALFDLNHHNAATSLQVDRDAASSMELPHFTLCKWETHNEENCRAGEAKLEEDELLQSKSCTPQLRHRGTSQNSESEEQKPEKKGSSLGFDDQARKERLRSLSMFGTLVSPKLRAAQLSFETALDMLVEAANTRASLLSAYDKVKEGVE